MTDHRAIAGHYNVHRVEAETKLAAIGSIHQPKNRKCVECGHRWPCTTARILDSKAGELAAGPR